MVFRCDAMLCCWFAVGLIEEELVKKGREEMAEHRERRKAEHWVLENFYYGFFVFFVFNFLICADVEICGSFKSFGFKYIIYR